MSTKQYPLIAREGWTRLLLIAVVSLVLYFGLGTIAALPAWLYFLITAYQFRDPTRVPPSLPLAVVSPIHGKVTQCTVDRDPWLDRSALVIEIRGGPFDIKSLYSPTEGKIMDQRRASADNPAGDNAIAYWLQTDEADDVILEIKQSGWPGPLSFRYHPGERVGQGRRVGFVNNGCTARVYLADSSLPKVEKNDVVVAGASVLAEFVHFTNMAESQDK